MLKAVGKLLGKRSLSYPMRTLQLKTQIKAALFSRKPAAKWNRSWFSMKRGKEFSKFGKGQLEKLTKGGSSYVFWKYFKKIPLEMDQFSLRFL